MPTKVHPVTFERFISRTPRPTCHFPEKNGEPVLYLQPSLRDMVLDYYIGFYKDDVKAKVAVQLYFDSLAREFMT